MPNYYAHSIFGRKICDSVSPDLRAVIKGQWQGYACGQYGPDPLFFYQLWHRNPVERQGHTLHETSPRKVLERLRRPIENETPYTLGYALGFLCHFLLDSSCHPYVRAVSARGEISHLAMEGEFDRYLMRQAGIKPHKITPMERPSDPAVFKAAACAYEGVTPKQFQHSMRGFYFASRMLTRFQGTVFCPAVDLATRGNQSASRMLLRKRPAKPSLVTSVQLEKRLNGAVNPGGGLVEQLYQAYLRGTPINFLPALNFQGEPVERSLASL